LKKEERKKEGLKKKKKKGQNGKEERGKKARSSPWKTLKGGGGGNEGKREEGEKKNGKKRGRKRCSKPNTVLKGERTLVKVDSNVSNIINTSTRAQLPPSKQNRIGKRDWPPGPCGGVKKNLFKRSRA